MFIAFNKFCIFKKLRTFCKNYVKITTFQITHFQNYVLFQKLQLFKLRTFKIMYFSENYNFSKNVI